MDLHVHVAGQTMYHHVDTCRCMQHNLMLLHVYTYMYMYQCSTIYWFHFVQNIKTVYKCVHVHLQCMSCAASWQL